MAIVMCETRNQIMAADGHLLIVGGPGSGKTTIALKKAIQLIERGLKPGQAVLFLSFSKAAVARIVSAAQLEVPKAFQRALNVQTFHSFFWEILRSHAYLLGCPKKRLKLLLPHDERALSGGLFAPTKDQEVSAEWDAWLAERERMFRDEGKITFDQFAPKVAELLNSCSLLADLISSRYPVLIVDEAQDTGPDAWRCVELLSAKTIVHCLGDLEQQIFDHLPGVGPERIVQIRDALHPAEFDLGGENNRSAGTEILTFANNIRDSVVRPARYVGVGRQLYNPNTDNANRRFRIALARANRATQRVSGKRAQSIAILAPSGAAVAKITAALSSGDKPVRHKVIFDEAAALLSARVAAFLLEPKVEAQELRDAGVCLELVASIRRANGGKTALADAKKYLKWANEVSGGKQPQAALPKAALALVRAARAAKLVGDPRADWLLMKTLLKNAESDELSRLASHLDYMIAFNKGKRIAAALANTWQQLSSYVSARSTLDSAMIDDQIFGGAEDLRGVHVMTMHRSKAKQFDAVIIYAEAQPIGMGKWRSSLVWRDDPPPYARSRKVLRVAITRARSHVLMLMPAYPACPIVSAHTL